MDLLEDFSFIDAKNHVWTAKTTLKNGTQFAIDGASIPKELQWVFGSPYVGDFRRASVVHDYYSIDVNREARDEDVHRMMYEAMLADGVKPWKAKLMYLGLRIGGPKW